MRSVAFAFGMMATAFANPEVVTTSVQGRLGWDSNPVAAAGSSAAVLGEDGSPIYAVGATVGITGPAAKFTYAGELVRFVDRSSENFSTHRFGLAYQQTSGAWKCVADGSSLYVDGSRDTLTSVATVNANSIALWRERRAQWQHRLKLAGEYTSGSLLLRPAFSALAYDYGTRTIPGRVAFADRSDIMAAADVGWKQSATSLWLAGGRVGHQDQAQVPLPNCAFDYSNNYSRLALGWEGKPTPGSSVSLLAGPDFRHYSGVIDRKAFLGGRDRTSLWLEANATAKPSARITIAGKAVRMDWLSSTGKSAYIDTCAETSVSYAATPRAAVRLSGKIHRCDYFPTIRDDFESFVGGGFAFTVSPQANLAVDVMRHIGWNGISALPERQFQRTLVTLGLNVQL